MGGTVPPAVLSTGWEDQIKFSLNIELRLPELNAHRFSDSKSMVSLHAMQDHRVIKKLLGGRFPSMCVLVMPVNGTIIAVTLHSFAQRCRRESDIVDSAAPAGAD